MSAETFWFLGMCVAALGWSLDSARASAVKAERDTLRKWRARIRNQWDDICRERDDHRLGELAAKKRLEDLKRKLRELVDGLDDKAKKGGQDGR